MNLKQIEIEALHLSGEEREELIRRLLLSLAPSTEDKIAENWLLEAKGRAKAIDDGIVQLVPADEVRRKAQALLR